MFSPFLGWLISSISVILISLTLCSGYAVTATAEPSFIFKATAATMRTPAPTPAPMITPVETEEAGYSELVELDGISLGVVGFDELDELAWPDMFDEFVEPMGALELAVLDEVFVRVEFSVVVFVEFEELEEPVDWSVDEVLEDVEAFAEEFDVGFEELVEFAPASGLALEVELDVELLGSRLEVELEEEEPEALEFVEFEAFAEELELDVLELFVSGLEVDELDEVKFD